MSISVETQRQAVTSEAMAEALGMNKDAVELASKQFSQGMTRASYLTEVEATVGTVPSMQSATDLAKEQTVVTNEAAEHQATAAQAKAAEDIIEKGVKQTLPFLVELKSAQQASDGTAKSILEIAKAARGARLEKLGVFAMRKQAAAPKATPESNSGLTN